MDTTNRLLGLLIGLVSVGFAGSAVLAIYLTRRLESAMSELGTAIGADIDQAENDLAGVIQSEAADLAKVIQQAVAAATAGSLNPDQQAALKAEIEAKLATFKQNLGQRISDLATPAAE